METVVGPAWTEVNDAAERIADRLVEAADALLGPACSPEAEGYVAGVARLRDVPAYVLAMARLATLPQDTTTWQLYQHLQRADCEMVMRAGLEGLLLDPALPAAMRNLINRLRELHHWQLWETRRRDHEARKARWPTNADAPPWIPDWDAVDLDGLPNQRA